MRILLAVAPVDFRKGIDGLVAVCRQVLHSEPFGGTLFVFGVGAGAPLKLLVYDGQGFWLFRNGSRKAVFPGGRNLPTQAR